MRIGYSEEERFPGQFHLWEANTRRQLAGKRGQKALRELEQALLAMPQKRLISGGIVRDGCVCAAGALLAHKRMQKGMSYDEAIAELQAMYMPPDDDPDDPTWYTDEILDEEKVAPTLAAWHFVYVNDIELCEVTAERRYDLVLAWVRRQINPEAESTP